MGTGPPIRTLLWVPAWQHLPVSTCSGEAAAGGGRWVPTSLPVRHHLRTGAGTFLWLPAAPPLSLLFCFPFSPSVHSGGCASASGLGPASLPPSRTLALSASPSRWKTGAKQSRRPCDVRARCRVWAERSSQRGLRLVGLTGGSVPGGRAGPRCVPVAVSELCSGPVELPGNSVMVSCPPGAARRSGPAVVEG